MEIYKLRRLDGYFRMKGTFKKPFVPVSNEQYFYTDDRALALSMINEKVSVFEDEDQKGMFDREMASLVNDLRSFGVGWYVKFEYNSVIDGINAILYTEKQAKKGRCEKVFVYLTKREALKAAYRYKLGDGHGRE